MSENRDRLLSLVQNRAFMRGEVTLSSGQKSDFYIDGKMIEFCPEGAFLIGEVLYEEIADMDIDAIGGLAIGAVPLVTSVAISCYNHDKDIEGFFVREEAKSHGTKKSVEGKLPEGARVVILDDVVTSGKSVMKAVDAVRDRGAEIVAILSIVDRDAGAKQFFAERGLDYRSVFTKQDVLAYAHA